MKREWFNFVIGVIIFLIPFLGFPRAFNSAVLGVAGVLLIVVSLRHIRRAYVHELDLTKPKIAQDQVTQITQSNQIPHEEILP